MASDTCGGGRSGSTIFLVLKCLRKPLGEAGRTMWKAFFLVCTLNVLCQGTLCSQTLHGFALAGDPSSLSGATWTYQDTLQGIIYDLAGILFTPGGGTSYPAVIISHGHSQNVSTYTTHMAEVMRAWGLVCIGTNYTHAGGVPIGSPGDSTQPGASEPNILRARKCYDILASLGYVDTTRIAAHGYSMGAFVTAAVVGAYPTSFRVASHTAGGVNDHRLAWTKTPQAAGIVTPYQIHHGDSDSTVPLQDDVRLDSILQADGVDQAMYVYPGYTHDNIPFDSLVLDRVHAWYTAHGMFPSTGVGPDDRGGERAFELAQNYPDPFNPVTTIRFSLPVQAHVTLRLYSLLGQPVRTLLDENRPPGPYDVQVDGSGLASGMYFYRLEAVSADDPGRTFSSVRAMLLVR